MDKAELRRSLLEQRKKLSAEEQDTLNRRITWNVLNDDRYLQSKTIFFYYSVEDEIDTHVLITDALMQGKRVCVPKCLPKRQMEARQILSEADLTEETFGIPEPNAQCAVIPPEEIDLCIIPALACDQAGVRLGYGGGFYDRFLPRTNAFRLILCPQSRFVKQLPAEQHDICCDAVATEREVILFHEQ